MNKTLMSCIGALALAGCMNGGGPDSESDDSAARAPTNIDPELTAFAEQARRDLSQRVELAAEAIEIERAEYVTWRSGAVGCPEPGTGYTQALVPGYRIVLKAGGAIHHYHGARGRAPFRCPGERIDKPLPDAPANRPDLT